MLTDLSPLNTFIAPQTTIPEASLEVQQLCVMDWAVCGLGALRDPILAGMARYAPTAGRGDASVFYTKDMLVHGASARFPPRAAAMINGTISHALDFDDTHFAHIGHVSTVVIPAALAVAETHGADFEAFLRASRIGAELATRVGLWLGRTHYQTGWHQTATSGAFGAAAAAAVLTGASPTATFLNVAGFVAGQKAQFGSAMKPMNAGMAAAQGVDAALLAKAGLCGSPDVLAALLKTHAGEGNISAFDGLGEAWLFDTVSHKYHACCHGTHAMIEALLALNLPPRAPVTNVEVRTHPRWMSVCNKPAPTIWLEGKFSYKFLAALTLSGASTIDPEPELYFPLSDVTQALMDSVTVVADDTISETATQVSVTLDTGEVRRAAHDLATPEPLEDRREKLIRKSEKLVGVSVTSEVMAAMSERDIAALTRLIRRID